MTMNRPDIPTPQEAFSESLAACHAVAKLNDLAEQLTGLRLVILFRTDERMVNLCVPGGQGCLPTFCQVFRGTEEGRRRCRTCRSLVAFGACYRGLIEYSCHGGTSVVAAPALHRDGSRSERVVVVSAAFAASSHARGWRVVAQQARETGADLRALREAYHDLPLFGGETLETAKAIVDAAAAVVGAMEEQFGAQTPHPAAPAELAHPADLVGQTGLPSSLVQLRDRSYRREGSSRGSALTDLVTAMVRRDPSMPFSVANIARAACLTPNHFSTLFHRHTGTSFSDFLTGERIALAQRLLTDPSQGVAEVARRSGFEDPAYFSRRFKQVTGTTPTTWRNEPDQRQDTASA